MDGFTMTKEDFFLINHFSSLKDPRVERTKKHKLLDIIILAICGVLAGCLGWEEIEIFGSEKEKWFKNFLELD